MTVVIAVIRDISILSLELYESYSLRKLSNRDRIGYADLNTCLYLYYTSYGVHVPCDFLYCCKLSAFFFRGGGGVIASKC